MQAMRQPRQRVAERHARTAQRHDRAAQRNFRAARLGAMNPVKLVVLSILGCILLTAFFTLMLGAGPAPSGPATTGTIQSQDSIDNLAHSLRADAQLQRIDAAIN